MIDVNRALLHRTVVERYKTGEISIDVNKSSALMLYARVSRNPLIKMFNLFVRVYSYPLTIIGVIFASVFIDRYLYILFYVIGLFGTITLEEHLSRVATIHSALENQNIFSHLQRHGVIYVRELMDTHVTI
ncbi:MAG TPA: hypothetical protein ENO00_10780 [Deltaproteobacteria bacterium]|nr:hypothetical protein [Deltaproteobacteria bacterium]